ncbi:MAG: helix-turn-helix transcriptional regulator [Gammaproteobacteria bacterium]|jgi:DNA-binding XRE family transcriptional regulator|nr:helix-turn-helix transcriptional regulator [Gammaproteobacteria bacterium]
MNEPTNVQIIEADGQPAFVVIPYLEWLAIKPADDNDIYIPHEVVGYQLKNNMSLIAAWRTYRGLSQAELAQKMDISQPAIAKLEKEGANPRKTTLYKLAHALDVDMEQLMV